LQHSAALPGALLPLDPKEHRTPAGNFRSDSHRNSLPAARAEFLETGHANLLDGLLGCSQAPVSQAVATAGLGGPAELEHCMGCVAGFARYEVEIAAELARDKVDAGAVEVEHCMGCVAGLARDELEIAVELALDKVDTGALEVEHCMGCVAGLARDKLETAVVDKVDTVAGVGQRTGDIAVDLGCCKVAAADDFDHCKVDTGVGFGQDGVDIADCIGFRMVDVVHAIATVQTAVLVRRIPGRVRSHSLHPQRKRTAHGLETPKKNGVYVFCLLFLSCQSYPSLIFCHQASHQLPTLREVQRPSLLRQSYPELQAPGLLRQFLWRPSCPCWISSGAVSPLQASLPREVAPGHPCWISSGAASPLQTSLSREVTPGRPSHQRQAQPSRRILHPISRHAPGAHVADPRQKEHTSCARTCHGSTSQVFWPPSVQSCLRRKT